MKPRTRKGRIASIARPHDARSCPRCGAELDMAARCATCRAYWTRNEPARTCPTCGVRWTGGKAEGLNPDGWCWRDRAFTGPRLEREADGGYAEREVPVLVARPESARRVQAFVAAHLGGEPRVPERTEAEREAHRQAVLAQADGLAAAPAENRLGLTEADWASLMETAETKA